MAKPGLAVHEFGVNIDITERKKAEAEREIMIEFLKSPTPVLELAI